jgi:uncharacterized protein with HEPN domain
MRSDQSRQVLRDILENARLARAFVAGLDAASFAADRRTVYAVTRCREIISEATRRLGPSIRDRHPSCLGERSCAQGTSIGTTTTT